MSKLPRVALVTGANRGIGFETARQLAALDVVVILSARSYTAAEQAVAQLHSEGHGAVLPMQLDVTNPDDRRAAVQRIENEFGRLDMLINNAAVGPRDGTLMDKRTIDTSLEELQEVFNTNLFGIVLLTHDLLELLKKSAAGRVVNVSSVLGSLTMHSDSSKPLAKRFAYSASKAALNVFTIHLAQELQATNIRVNSVHPGWARTQIGTSAATMTAVEAARTSVEAALAGPDGSNGRFLHCGAEIPW
jgi:NAD(P)-dependent dehydrogenase (short-subunit alcohol dehydrogenase family)